MPLASGTRLGPYEIVAPLGAGGMGEVYRARDTRLGRDVAVKVLPQHLSEQPEVRARFEREARTVSGLNHPHICTLFDVGRAPGGAGSGETDYLVMELVEGETLAARLARGPLPLDQALRLGGQIADALERAHRAGVVHRDLKPGNVMLTRAGAKLMDFGLARATGLAGPAGGSGVTLAGLTQSPTIAAPLTAEGTIVGTFQYMAPEQLEGREADVRSDVWALGCVLYEMITGQPAFSGKSQASLIGAIMSSEPTPMAQAAPVAPPALERLVKGCLAKDPDQRVQSAQEVKLYLAWITEAGSQAGVAAPVLGGGRRGRTRWIAWGVSAAAIVVAVVLGLLWGRTSTRPPVPMRFELRVPPNLSPAGPLRVSPNGRMAAFAATDSSGVSRLWLRSFDDLECRPLPGTEGAGRPFWSPDSRYLGFFADNKLKKILAAGGRPETVCEAPGGSDGTWSNKNVVLFDGDRAHNLIRGVKATGGDPQAATRVDSLRGEVETDWPEALPDGEHFLFIMSYSSNKPPHLFVGRLGSPEVKPVMDVTSRVEFVPPGYLLFERDGALLAQRFDPGAGKLSGEPHTLADQIGINAGNAMPYFSASHNGVLVYSRGSSDRYRMVWVDRGGKAGDAAIVSGAVTSLALSPDGRRLAYQQLDAGGNNDDIWVRDMERGVSSRVTTDPGDDIWPTWGPDSRTLYWASNRQGRYAVYTRSLDRVEADSMLFHDPGNCGPVSASSDGVWLAVSRARPDGGWTSSAVPLHGGAPVPIGGTGYSVGGPRFAPGGRWVSYTSTQSGLPQVYVQAFPGPAPPIQITSRGGFGACWRADGRELYYRSLEQRIYAVDVKTEGGFDAGQPHELFAVPPGMPSTTRSVSTWAAAGDGQRFLLILPEQAESAWLPVAVFDWPSQLGR